jgi:hypothetical protein
MTGIAPYVIIGNLLHSIFNKMPHSHGQMGYSDILTREFSSVTIYTQTRCALPVRVDHNYTLITAEISG